MEYYVNGSWVPAAQAGLPLSDKGFLYGLQLFETLRVENGTPFRGERHLSRLRKGLSLLEISAIPPDSWFLDLFREFIDRNNLTQGLLRLIVTGGSLQKVPWEPIAKPAIYLTGRTLSPRPPEPVKVVFLPEERFPLLRFFPAIKSGSYLGNVLAKREAARQGAFEPVFFNREGLITEGAIRNIFLVRADRLLTPSLELGILPGVIRGAVMEVAQQLGVEVMETKIFRSQLQEMDEAFITSTGVGILSVYWDGFTSQYGWTRKLQQAFNELLQLETRKEC